MVGEAWFGSDSIRKAFFAVTARGGKRSVFALTFLVKTSIGWGVWDANHRRTISYVRRITPTPNQTFCHPIHLEGESKINGHYKALQLSDPRPVFFVCSANYENLIIFPGHSCYFLDFVLLLHVVFFIFAVSWTVV